MTIATDAKATAATIIPTKRAFNLPPRKDPAVTVLQSINADN
jgi:hypothetical protein